MEDFKRIASINQLHGEHIHALRAAQTNTGYVSLATSSLASEMKNVTINHSV